jgi:hypothetical protein
LRFVKRLLENDAGILRLMKGNPFAGGAPTFVRAQFYQYWYTTPEERRATGAWWRRELLGTYMPAVDLGVLRDV